MTSQKRPAPWLLVPRVDSRYLLKTLICINVFLAFYLIATLAPGSYRSSPCLVILDNNSNSVTTGQRAALEGNVSFPVLQLTFSRSLTYTCTRASTGEDGDRLGSTQSAAFLLLSCSRSRRGCR